MNAHPAPSLQEQGELLSPVQLDVLLRSFRDWAAEPETAARAASRMRILGIFLLIRYTGAKLNEVQALMPALDVDYSRNIILFRQGEGPGVEAREVRIASGLATELSVMLPPLAEDGEAGRPFAVDPAFVRRKFYERAVACGFPKKLGGPEMIRKARAVELMQNNVPLPAVQRLLGHSTPNLTTSYMSFSQEDLAEITRLFMEREAGRRTSARNSFFGKVRNLTRSDVQTLVKMDTADGESVSTMITNTSVERLGLKAGRLVTAEVKAPWLILERADRPGRSSVENTRRGIITRIRKGAVNTECTVRIPDGTELCAILSTPGFEALELDQGDEARVLFSSYAVILQAD